MNTQRRGLSSFSSPANTQSAKRKQRVARKRGAWNRLLPWLKFECLEDRSLLAVDFGDAPDLGAGTGAGDYQTSLANNGPRHTTDATSLTLFLGASVDSDVVAFPNSRANGDDVDGALPDDEDGVLSPLDLVGTAGAQPTITLQATNNTGTAATLSGWIDYNKNGLFDNATERAQVVVSTGTTNGRFTLTLPAVPQETTGKTYARFRLSTDIAAQDSTGLAANGEVEDYVFTLTTTSTGTVDGFKKIANEFSGGPTLANSDFFSSSVASLGDLDGDGVNDVAVGARGDDTDGSYRGAVHVLLLNSDGSVKSKSKIASGEGGPGAPVLADFDNFGYSVAALGDVDGDGVTDLAVGARGDDTNGDYRGAVHVLFLNVNGSVKGNTKIASGAGGGPALENFDLFGSSLAGLGDLDGDGVPDLAVGTPGDDTGGSYAGSIRILLLNANGTVKGSSLIENGTPNGPALSAGNRFGNALTTLGDIDGDGVIELAVGARKDNAGGTLRGAVHVIRLNANGTVKGSAKITHTAGGGPTLTNEDEFGTAVASLGDIDADGVPDLAVGARGDDANGSARGAVYVFLLNATGTAKNSTKIASAIGGGPTLANDDVFGSSLSALGDINGDGVTDLAVGAYGDDTGGAFCGAVHVLFLQPTPVDFGDAPDANAGTGVSNYNTTRSDNGARHLVFSPTTVFLGDKVDGDSGTLQNAAANADDVNQGVRDDEDGVLSPLDLQGTVGGAPTIALLATNTSGAPATLSGWIDYDKDGLFDNVMERAQIAVPNGTTDGRFTLTFPAIPAGSTGKTYVRFRLSSDIAAANPTGLAVNGEVEDYVFTVTRAGASPGGMDSSKTTKIVHQVNGGPTLANDDLFGRSVASLGDLGGNGVSVLVVGADFDDAGGQNRGAVHVLFLSSNGTVISNVKLSSGVNGVPILGDNDNFGSSVASLGDIDGDGIADLAVGSRGDDTGGSDRGAVYVLLLNANGTVKGSTKIANGTAGGPVLADSDLFGRSVASLGDIDGDGVTDLAVGADFDDAGGQNRGAVHVLFLNASGTVRSSVKLASGANGVSALADGDNFGSSVASLGDLDGDGVSDLAVGARGDDTGGGDRGAVYVLFMNATGTAKSSTKIANNLGGGPSLTDSDLFGFSVASLGDVDGDGVTDIAVGAIADDSGGGDRGSVYLLLMNANGTAKSTLKVASSTGGGPTLTNGDNFGRSVASLGDLNGDGMSDIAIGAYRDDTGGTDRGAVYVLFPDVQPPVLQSYTRQNPAVRQTGANTLIFLATFNEAVSNVNAADFAVSGTTTATIASVSEVTSSTYSITVSGGDLANFNGVVGLNLAAGQNITDAAGNALPAGEPTTDEDYLLDNAAPTLNSINRFNPAAQLTNADSLVFRATFSEVVTGVTAGNFAVVGSSATIGSVTTSDGGVTWSIIVSGGDLANLGGAVGLNLVNNTGIVDGLSFGLDISTLTGQTYNVENVRPTLNTINRQTPATASTSDDTLTFLATFSEAVTGVTASNFVVAGSAVANIGTPASGDGGISWSITLSGGDLEGFNGTVGLNLTNNTNITDIATNVLLTTTLVGQTYTLSNVSPSLNSINRQTPAAVRTKDDSLTFLATFSEIVTGVTAANFAVVGSSASVGTPTSGNGGLSWSITISGGDLANLNGAVGLNLVNNTNIQNAAFNGLTTTTFTGQTFQVDNAAPVLNSISRAVGAANPTNADSLTFLATFNEAVTAVSAANFAVVGSTASVGTPTSSDGGVSWSIVVSGGNLAGFNGAVGLNLFTNAGIADLALNLLSTTSLAGQTFNLDNNAPVITSFTRQAPATNPTSDNLLVFRATFNEDVQNVDGTDFVVVGTTATDNAFNPVNASEYDITVSGGNLANLNGTVGLNLNGTQNITDTAGNALPAGEPATDQEFDVTNIPPGGNIVAVKQQAGTKATDFQLKLDGDALDNRLRIDLGVDGVKNKVRLTGLGTTTINGQPTADFDGITKGILASLLAGADEITVNGTKVAGPISIDGGEGNDVYIIGSKSIKFALKDSAGLDTIDFSAQLLKGAKIDLAKLPGKKQGLGNGNTTTIDGIWENVIGTQFKDTFKGNAANNRLEGRGGNDTLDGRAGDDLLLGAEGKDKLTGGLGNDILLGGTENDTLKATDGFDLLIGGAAKDSLTSGKAGNSLLIGGTTDFDLDLNALAAIRDEWARTIAPNALLDRVANLETNGVGPGNAIKLGTTAPTDTVIDDLIADTLKTSGVDNWIFKFATDKHTGKKPGGKISPA